MLNEISQSNRVASHKSAVDVVFCIQKQISISLVVVVDEAAEVDELNTHFD